MITQIKMTHRVKSKLKSKKLRLIHKLKKTKMEIFKMKMKFQQPHRNKKKMMIRKNSKKSRMIKRKI